MNKGALSFVSALIALIVSVPASADEGMWLIQNINSALEKKMQERGLNLSAGEIYNADAPGASVSDAIVSLGFYCTGSIISDKGLMITNHHCAYSDIYELSTPEHNYLEDGYWALQSDQEIPVPGKEVFFLKRVLDVTAEVEEMQKSLQAEGKPFGMRKLTFEMEKKYKKATGMESYMSSMWSGTKYYMALYEVYKDLRLVAAPPVSVAAFGGDIDNWEWPQHKCDFAMYRVYMSPDGKPAKYSKDNIPLKPLRKLEISLDGYKPGDFTMVIGYPGSTNRYSSSMETDYEQRVSLPIANRFRSRQMQIMKKRMDADPAVWMKYSDTYFGFSNLGEMQEGELACLKRFRVMDAKEKEEVELQNWIEADPERKAKWGGLLQEMKDKYAETEDVERNKSYYRGLIFNGTIIARTIMRMNSAKGDYDKMKGYIKRGLAETDPGVEKELLRYSVGEYFTLMDNSYFGPYHKELADKFGSDYDAMTDYIWEGTYLSSPQKAEEFTDSKQFEEDRLRKFLTDINIHVFNNREDSQQKRQRINVCHKEYTRALYQMRAEKGLAQYPDANSTMRISYGVVGDLVPRDGVLCSWQTTQEGIKEKYDPKARDYKPSDEFMSHLKKGEWGRWSPSADMPIDFLTDNDITGGNSGSPVLNAEGKLIGLAFDGNKESLASDLYYTDGYNKCVCVDIRYILWVLDKHAGMNRVIEEIGL